MFVKKPVSPFRCGLRVRRSRRGRRHRAVAGARPGRIDIPTRAITRIEALATQTFTFTDTQETRTYDMPNVELCYSSEIQQRVCQLTRQIVDQPMSIVVDCEIISSPVVREPLCGECFLISANDIQEANALAQRLRQGSNCRCAPVS